MLQMASGTAKLAGRPRLKTSLSPPKGSRRHRLICPSALEKNERDQREQIHCRERRDTIDRIGHSKLLGQGDKMIQMIEAEREAEIDEMMIEGEIDAVMIKVEREVEIDETMIEVEKEVKIAMQIVEIDEAMTEVGKEEEIATQIVREIKDMAEEIETEERKAKAETIGTRTVMIEKVKGRIEMTGTESLSQLRLERIGQLLSARRGSRSSARRAARQPRQLSQKWPRQW